MSPLFLSFKRGVRRFEFCVSVIKRAHKESPVLSDGAGKINCYLQISKSRILSFL